MRVDYAGLTPSNKVGTDEFVIVYGEDMAERSKSSERASGRYVPKRLEELFFVGDWLFESDGQVNHGDVADRYTNGDTFASAKNKMSLCQMLC